MNSANNVITFHPKERKTVMSIEVKDLNFYYNKDSQALFNINLNIEKNKVTALIGPSGSGKSTLLRAMNRIYDLHAKQMATGEVLFENNNVLKASKVANLRKRMGMVFQKPTTFPMNIYQNIAFALKHHERLSRKELDQRIEDALRQAALWDEVKDKLKAPATALSGGQQQRLCLARTLAMCPEVLLLDEPTSALDPASTQKIEELILTLKERYTIVLVTHNLRQAQRVADYTAFMRQGRLVEFASTDNLFKAPQEQATLDYIQHA
ncbi:phosphate ABC transporter ATP-binding protein PstB [Piscirickettsia litoralis]|uniref:Phosphate ABC transporter ATP-binding protein n=1 Tax=Piscirickettsia litoralis TaxID=1891921 RepID=A0ABX3A7E2_9GAMM|nr:phosphate ABC transporter ATP-binding protein PstB [Piscirickettsia litoralis]ODN43553.1 phosphate ABC transporter ATP-binding protein [Piscirickettsia litoralis]